MLDMFASPVCLEDILGDKTLSDFQFGKNIDFYNGSQAFSDYDLVLVGVAEERGAVNNKGTIKAPNEIRASLFNLDFGNGPLKILDGGNINPGERLADTYSAIAAVSQEIMNAGAIPILIGGSHDLSYGQYQGYVRDEQIVNICMIDEKIDLYKQSVEINAESFLYPIFTADPNHLFNFSHIGCQAHYVPVSDIHTLEKLRFDIARLGACRDNFEQTEPLFRDADMVSIDISAVRAADAPGHAHASPNGFFGEELCRMARYAGISEKVSSIGLFEVNPDFDMRGRTSQLAAQIIWYFIDGFRFRKNELQNLGNEKDFIRFLVPSNDVDVDLIFWKSKNTDRWWLQLQAEDPEKYRRHQWLPCSYKDYLQACNGDLPERYIRAFEKLH